MDGAPIDPPTQPSLIRSADESAMNSQWALDTALRTPRTYTQCRGISVGAKDRRKQDSVVVEFVNTRLRSSPVHPPHRPELVNSVKISTDLLYCRRVYTCSVRLLHYQVRPEIGNVLSITALVKPSK